jgi:hypothetical protein
MWVKERVMGDVMRSQIGELRPSPYDPKLRWLEFAKYLGFAIAGYCGWQIAEWWGVGLVGALAVVDFFNDSTQDIYRTELLKGLGRTAVRIESGEWPEP